MAETAKTPTPEPTMKSGADITDADIKRDPTLRGIGTVTNQADGSGTRQTDPKPADYPVQARVLPPLEQVNPRMAQAVGSIIGKPDAMNDAIQSGIEQHADKLGEAHEGAQEIADMRRDLEDKLASREAA